MKEMKIRIKNEAHCKQVQDALFTMGCRWYCCGQTHMNEDIAGYLYIDTDGIITWSSYSDEDFFEDQSEPEYKLMFGRLMPMVYIPDTECPQIIVEDTHGTVPVLGLTPRVIRSKERLIEILEAMLRFAKTDMIIPDEWDNEYDELREYLNAGYQEQIDFDELLEMSTLQVVR